MSLELIGASFDFSTGETTYDMVESGRSWSVVAKGLITFNRITVDEVQVGRSGDGHTRQALFVERDDIIAESPVWKVKN